MGDPAWYAAMSSTASWWKIVYKSRVTYTTCPLNSALVSDRSWWSAGSGSVWKTSTAAARNPAHAQDADQGGLIDDRSARGVDEDGGGLHRP
jgi:hypothetical protein